GRVRPTPRRAHEQGSRRCRPGMVRRRRSWRHAHLEYAVHLDREVERQDIDADRRARMAAMIAEYLDHQIGAAIHDLRLLGEILGGIDEDPEAHASDAAGEIAG